MSSPTHGIKVFDLKILESEKFEDLSCQYFCPDNVVCFLHLLQFFISMLEYFFTMISVHNVYNLGHQSAKADERQTTIVVTDRKKVNNCSRVHTGKFE